MMEYLISKIPTTDNCCPDLKLSLVNYFDISIMYKYTPRVNQGWYRAQSTWIEVQVVGVANKAHPRIFRAEVATEKLWTPGRVKRSCNVYIVYYDCTLFEL